jgi:hemolysin III
MTGAHDDVEAAPMWRGVIHKYGAMCSVVAGVVLVVQASTPRARIGAAVFSLSLQLLLTVSALYHRIHWSNAALAWWRRADHASIFVLIAGTYTPFALLRMRSDLGDALMLLSWGGAVLFVCPSLFWRRAPHALIAVLCVTLGWVGVPFWTDPRNTIDATSRLLLLGGGFFYTAGAVCYAIKRPALSARVFGHHELFHACTIVAAAMHYASVWRIT